MKLLLSTLLSVLAGLMQGGMPIPVGSPSATGGGTPPSYVQETDCHWFGGGGTSETCTLGSNVAATDGVVVFVSWQTITSTISSVADANMAAYGNTAWASGAGNCSTSGGNTLVYSLANSAGGSGTNAIKVTWSADPGFGAISVFEASNVATTSMVDKADCQNQPSTTTPTSPSVTTTGTDFLAAAGFDTNGVGSNTWTAGSPPAYTFVGTSGSYFGQEYFVQSSGAAVTGNFNTTVGVYSNTAVVGLKP